MLASRNRYLRLPLAALGRPSRPLHALPYLTGSIRRTNHIRAAGQTQTDERTSPISFASRLKDGRALQIDVWSIFSAANFPAHCINLSAGYMNFSPPQWARDAAEAALGTVEGNHYSPAKGRPRLRDAIRAFYGREFGKELDVDNEIVVTSGANEGQYAAFAAFLEPGDEVIVFEPFFDQYLASIVFNGGKPVYVPLHPSSTPVSKYGRQTWTMDVDELQRAITPRTKMIVLNTPHNPVGKVFTVQELQAIAELARKHNLLVMSDEVYDKLLYDQREHVRIATLPGMWERTLTVGSAGKLFAATGWRVGWLVGAPALIAPTLAATTRIVYCSNTPLQDAVATAIEQAEPQRYFEEQLEQYVERRKILSDALEKLGLVYTQPEGSYYIMADISKVRWPDDYPFPSILDGRGRDFKAAWFIASEIGISCIPVSEFYCEEHRSIGESFVRFSFCKDVDTLRRAGERLQDLGRYIH